MPAAPSAEEILRISAKEGRGVPEDLAEAAKWFHLATRRQGVDKAEGETLAALAGQALTRLALRIGADRMAEAAAGAGAFRPRLQ